MRITYKYPLDESQTVVRLPKDHEITHWGFQDGRVCFWASIPHPNQPHPSDIYRTFSVVSTGMAYPDHHRSVASVLDKEGLFVWHVLEEMD